MGEVIVEPLGPRFQKPEPPFDAVSRSEGYMPKA